MDRFFTYARVHVATQSKPHHHVLSRAMLKAADVLSTIWKSTSVSVMGVSWWPRFVVGGGCKNKEIKDSIYLRNKEFVDGTNLSMIKPDRKLNSNNRTGVKGVSFIASKQKYRAQITIKGKLINLGEYDTLEEAKIAREKGEDEYFKPILGKEN